jgi:hypothetical protein
MDWFILRVTGNQATAVIAGPISGAEAYAAFAHACMDDEGGTVVVVPGGIVSDIVRRSQALVG